jgi:hypothetical protein
VEGAPQSSYVDSRPRRLDREPYCLVLAGPGIGGGRRPGPPIWHAAAHRVRSGASASLPPCVTRRAHAASGGHLRLRNPNVGRGQKLPVDQLIEGCCSISRSTLRGRDRARLRRR